MNSTRFTILTSSDKFIRLLEASRIVLRKLSDFVYETVVPVYAESKLCNVIAECADDAKATVAVHIFYQDPGTGESSISWMMIPDGKSLR